MGNELGSRYLLDEQIGHGGMGVVWRGHDRKSDAVYAIKVLRPDYASDGAAVGRFVRERTALLSFRHPHVVTLHDMIVEGDRLALVMDLVPGGDLSRLRNSRGGRLAPREAAGLAAQIADALAAAHAAGITHRDIKPENVLMRDEGHVLLADFGIARVASQSRDTTTGMVLGTAEYLAPELIAGQEPGPAGDVYSLGVTLYELVAGQPPFTGNAAAVLHAHVSAAPKRPQAIGKDLWPLISRCLAKAPADRPAAAELAAALADFADSRASMTHGGPSMGLDESSSPLGAGGRGPAGGQRGEWAGPTGPFHEVAMRPLGDLNGRPTSKTRRLIPSRGAAIASAVAVAAAIVAVVMVNPFKSATAKPAAASVAAPAATTTKAASQPTRVAATHPKAARTRKPDAGQSAVPAPATTSSTGTASAKPSSAPVSDDTAWECSAISKQDTANGKSLKSCIKIQGTTVYLEGYVWTIPSDLPSDQYEQVEIVLHTPNGDIGRYTSPHCAAGTCEYSLSVTEPAGEYWAQADYLWDGINEYQAGFTPKVTVTG